MTGLSYEQRNSLVVGVMMGFAVIPIIFTISEDALSNVPPTLRSGSLALGASRWQTAMSVVLPTASAGIFSAVMIGFGRAIGETMIVVMATGNTPIMSMNIFDGMRTLSANIAVEIPEAPHHGTLYRTLFLGALLLFLLTFVVNTVAEVMRQHLREKYKTI
jgi:phosphate transport system permease protein